jgi:hypothetical protein
LTTLQNRVPCFGRKKKQINNATKHFVDFHGLNPWPKFGKNIRNRTMSVINKTCKTIYLKFTFQGSKKTANLKKDATKHVIEKHVNFKIIWNNQFKKQLIQFFIFPLFLNKCKNLKKQRDKIFCRSFCRK